MLFNSYVFLLGFLPVVFTLFQLASRRLGRAAATGVLALASLVFYGWWNPAYVGLILASIAFNYAMGRRIEGLAPPARRVATALGIAVNLAVLGFFKYAFFVSTTLAALLGTPTAFEWVVLPLGISFFTFQKIAYLADIHAGEPAERDPLRFAAFVLFFPQLIAGPIVHPRDVLPQLRALPARVDLDLVALGLAFLALGLVKKTVLADGVAAYATPVFADAAAGRAPDLVLAWQGALAYTFQLFFDFSGYSDMAIGLGLMFGIRLPLNFADPYRATGIAEFWRRWHMTLSRFLRDYLYIPLGGNRHGAARRYANLLLTMLLGGLWHGAGWTFVVWGALHGLYLCLDHAWQALRDRLGIAPARSFWRRALAWAVTFLAVVVAWVVFRAESLAAAGLVLRGMAGLEGVVLPYAYAGPLGPLADGLRALGVTFAGGAGMERLAAFAWIAGLLALTLLAPTTQALLRYAPPAPDAAPRTPPAPALAAPGRGLALATGACAALGILALSSVSEFLYFQF